MFFFFYTFVSLSGVTQTSWPDFPIIKQVVSGAFSPLCCKIRCQYVRLREIKHQYDCRWVRTFQFLTAQNQHFKHSFSTDSFIFHTCYPWYTRSGNIFWIVFSDFIRSLRENSWETLKALFFFAWVCRSSSSIWLPKSFILKKKE